MAAGQPKLSEIAVGALIVFSGFMLVNYLRAPLSPDGTMVLEELCAEEIASTQPLGRVEQDTTECVRTEIVPVPLSVWLQSTVKRVLFIAPPFAWLLVYIWHKEFKKN